MKLHIELLGIAGSGKSSLYRHALESGSQHGVPLAGAADSVLRGLAQSPTDRWRGTIAQNLPRRLRERLWRRLFKRSRERMTSLTRFMSLRPELLEIVLRSQNRRAAIERSSAQLLEWMMDLFATYQLASESLGPHTSLLLDEGFCNRAISLLGYQFDRRDAEDLAAYMATIPRPHHVIWIDAPVEQCAARLDRRGWPERFAELGPEARMAYLFQSRECALATIGLLPPEVVATIENDRTLEAAQDRLDAALRGFASRA